MKRTLKALVLAITVCTFMSEATGTDRFFNDIVSESPPQRYKVTAKSPENSKKKGRDAFQAHFIYECRDTTSGKLLWTRKQPMSKPEPITKGSSTKRAWPTEGSPARIFVSDLGRTVMRTGMDELIAVGSQGYGSLPYQSSSRCHHGRGTAELRPSDDCRPDVGRLLSVYFLDSGDQHWFVIQPWWGRRVIVNLETGKLVRETDELAESALHSECARVLTELAEGVETQSVWEKEDNDSPARPPRTAAWLAGNMQLVEAISFLEKLQDSDYSGRSTGGGIGSGERFSRAYVLIFGASQLGASLELGTSSPATIFRRAG